jgi:O-antigen ligase
MFEAVAVILFFQLGIGTESDFFSDLLYGTASPGTLTVAQTGWWSHVSRSAGTFAHPSHAAYYFEYILPTVLACLMTTRRVRDRIMFILMMIAGCIGLVLTFSRSGIIGFICSSAVFFLIARWSHLITRQVFTLCVAIVALLAVMSTPIVIEFLDFRPEAVSIRWRLIEEATEAFRQRPITGAGLNNSSAATEGSRAIVLTTKGSSAYRMTVVHNYYLIVLIEIGVVGFVLLFGFFCQTVVVAFQYIRRADLQLRLLAAGIVSALVGIAVHNMADPFGGHSNLSMLWLHAGLIFAICHAVEVRSALPAPRSSASLISPSLSNAAIGAAPSHS